MGFWSDRVAEVQRQQVPPAPRTPASWWQGEGTQTAPQPPQNAPGQPQPQLRHDYSPDTSQRLDAADEACPRCGSDDYLSVSLDPSYGGRTGIAQTGFNMSNAKRCFNCRYPGPDASGNIMRKGAVAPTKGVKRQEVRQAGGGLDGTWSDASWDSAPLIA
jgi:predicted nucleic-acid-binding Zn-ribbon protein